MPTLVSRMPQPIAIEPTQTAPARTLSRSNRLWQPHLVRGLKNLLLVPLCPALGYILLDQTGATGLLIAQGPMFEAIVGEGFGHVGLCFSIHYAFYACRCFWKAGRLFFLTSS